MSIANADTIQQLSSWIVYQSYRLSDPERDPAGRAEIAAQIRKAQESLNTEINHALSQVKP